jgi:mutator protein MutT
LNRPTDELRGEGERPIQVGIGLIGRDGGYLIRQRPAGTVYQGYWEFPGGKCQDGESPAAATRRECREETGLDVQVMSLIRVVEHRYPHGWVKMHFYRCAMNDWQEEPAPGTGFQWVRVEDLSSLSFPEANGPILEDLAREMVYFQRRGCGGDDHAET